MYEHYLTECRKTTFQAYCAEITDAIQKDGQRAAYDLILIDADEAIRSFTPEDYRAHILDYIFSPLGYFEHDAALRALFFGTCLYDINAVIIDLTQRGIIDDVTAVKLKIQLINHIARHCIDIDVIEPDANIKAEMNRRRKTVTIDKNGVQLASIAQDPHAQDKVIKGYIAIATTPHFRALEQTLRTPKYEYEHPGQMSIFDDLGRAVDIWEESENPNARKITVTETSIGGKAMTLEYAIEDYKRLIKGNANADKALLYTLEKIQNAANPQTPVIFSISNFAERLGISPEDARKALKQSAAILASLQYRSPRGSYITVFPGYIIGVETLSTGEKIGTRGNVTVAINPLFDYTSGGTVTYKLPEAAWKLNKNAWFLASYIYSDLRRNAAHITPSNPTYTRKLKLTTAMEALRLSLPAETARIEQLIIDPIRKAIIPINEMDGGSISLSLDIDTQKAPFERLNTGYLIVTVTQGAYLESLKDVARKKTKHVEHKERKRQQKESRIDAAKGREQARIEDRNKKKGNPNNDNSERTN